MIEKLWKVVGSAPPSLSFSFGCPALSIAVPQSSPGSCLAWLWASSQLTSLEFYLPLPFKALGLSSFLEVDSLVNGRWNDLCTPACKLQWMSIPVP